ncbi:metal-dependent hydrolase [Microbacterium sp. ZXX196]|uniref:metal-dependent hydrolase n=1 Tax=Microbacterium sp. ZXX196 TaxID=2609291 RepID=UPI0012B8A0CA|nr:metal-dependent hydrolase [Microbacterium sp. ZXX196]MTE23001.1 metal-dependent hydrolase [Microbacterium sp. ZXX196]
MGYGHAISGAAAWIAVTTTAPGLGWAPLDPVGVLAGAAVCAGAALLPDIDHPSSTIAAGLPGGRVLAGAVGTATGGHRAGMHSLVALMAATCAAIALSFLTWVPEALGVELAVGPAVGAAASIAIGTKCLRLARGWFAAWLVGIGAAGGLMWFFPDEFGWFAACVGVGYLAHLVGDTLTTGGVPWLWPLMLRRPVAFRRTLLISRLWPRRGSFALPLLGNAGSWREWLLTTGLAAYALWGAGAQVIALAAPAFA